MRKILWYAFLLIPAVFTSCNLEDDSGLIPQENSKLTISFSVQDPASGLATRAAIAPEAGEENIKTLDLIFRYLTANGFHIPMTALTSSLPTMFSFTANISLTFFRKLPAC